MPTSPLEELESRPPRRWVRRTLIGSAIALALFTLIGFFVLPPVVRHVAESQLGSLLGRKVQVARVRVNPFALSLTVEGLTVYERDGVTPFVGFARLYVNAQLSSVYRRAPVVKEISLEAPRVHVARLTDGASATYNFSDILARFASTPEPAPPPKAADSALPRFSVNNIRIVDGEITLDDRPTRSTHTISRLNLGVPFVSTLPVFIDTYVQPGLHVQIDGAPFDIEGRSKPFKESLETTVELRIDDLDLTRLVPYVPLPLHFQVPSARLNVALDVAFVRPAADAPKVTVKGRVALDKLELRHQNQAPLAALDELAVVVKEADLTAQRFDVTSVKLAGLDVHARRLPDGTLDLETLIPQPPREPTRKKAERPVAKTKPSEPAPPLQFKVGQISVEHLALHLLDETVRPAVPLVIDRLDATVRGLSNARDAQAAVTLAVRLAPGAIVVRHEGMLSLTPLAATGKVTIDGIEPARFAPYYKDQITFDIEKGSVKAGGRYRFEERGETTKVGLSDLFAEIADLRLRRRAHATEDFLRLGALGVRGVTLDLDEHSASIGEVSSRDLRLRAERGKDGVVDLATLVAAPKVSPKAAPPAPPSPAAPAPAWTVNVAQIDIDHWGARFEDHGVDPPAVINVTPLALKASKLSTAPGARGNVDLKMGLNDHGKLAVAGALSLAPLAANLHVDLRTLEILPLQPYFADQVNLIVTDGKVSVGGQVKLDPPGKASKGAPPPDPNVHFDGDIDVQDFASVDGHSREQFLKWQSLHVGGLSLATAPVAVAVKDIALSDFFSRLMIFPDAHFNVEDVLAKPKAQDAKTDAKAVAKTTPAETPATPATTSSTPPAVPAPVSSPVTIGQVTLQGGHVSFTDRLIKPNYAAELTDLGGRLSGLSSDASTQADVDLRGSVDHSGVLTIDGKINPLAKNLFVDLKVDLKDFELPPTSPYAAKYAGYGISKGKLGLSLGYHVVNRKLDARNHLTLEQFTFGDKVDSPTATKLPVRLAIAILKDRHGVIDLDVPITGSLDDPDFKFGRAVLKVLGNLLVKAVTAPFSLIASAFGGGDQLSRLDFAPGLATLDGKAQDKIRALAKGLRERPGLSFEIEGGADPQRDREGLRQALFERKLRAQKVIELVRGGAAVASPDEIRIEPAERERLLTKAYEAEKFPKPRNFLGVAKSLPPAEMEKLMLTNTVVDEEALRALAQRRATRVQEALAKAEPDGASRLFLISPVVGARSDGTANRVELRMKKD